MKRIDFYYFLTLGILALASFGVPDIHVPKFLKHKPAKVATVYTHQQVSSHMVRFLEDGSLVSTCTSTAIGPHAILTGQHCNQEGDADQVLLDLSTERHHILAASYDRHDHVIYLLDGTAFTNYIQVVSGVPNLGDGLTLYGDVLGVYPALPRYGKVIDCEDPSDLDAAQGQQCFSMDVNHGDSGSAVYNTKGQIIGLLTYGYDGEDDKPCGISYALNFAQSRYDIAATFNGTKEGLPTD